VVPVWRARNRDTSHATLAAKGMRADAAGDTADPSAAAHEHGREMFRRPSHGRPRWNTSTNSKKPGGSARGVRVSEEEEAKANKWKTPFERALERVRTPRSKERAGPHHQRRGGHGFRGMHTCKHEHMHTGTRTHTHTEALPVRACRNG